MFEPHIRPILKTHCFHCHGEDGVRESNLDLRLRRWIIAGGDSGPSVEPGDPDASLILERIVSGEMPPGDKPVPNDDIQLIRQWIEQGAATARKEPETLSDEGQITHEEQSFWAFQPIQRPAVPSLKDPSQARNPIDHFVLAKLESKGLAFSPPADRATLARRMHFGLLGLPPELETAQRFISDPSPTAFHRLMEQLLASPAYGERWGRHWLDVAGYADSEGYSEEDRVRESAFRYRDYVIRALNDDKPMDVFICEQLAGDELIDKTTFQDLSPLDRDRLTATGFLRMAPDGTSSGGVDQNLARNQTIADTLDIVSTSLMGLTVACAQCHNHRYDPISQVDYYRLRAIFEPALDWKAWRSPQSRQVSLYSNAERTRKQEIEKEVATVEEQRKEKTQYYIDRTLEEELEEVEANKRESLRTAFKTPTKDRTPEQVLLLKEHPSIQNINPGSLYLYDRRRSEKANKLDTDRKEKTKQLLDAILQQAVEAAPADLRDALLAAKKCEPEKRTAKQTALLDDYPAILVTTETLSQFDPAGATELQALSDQAAELRNSKAADDLKRYTEKITQIRSRIPREGFIRALTEPQSHQPSTYLFFRGDHDQPRQTVAPGGLSVLNATAVIPSKNDQMGTTGRRLAFAHHLTNGKHPLVARVLVNRVWAHHFGHGIVRSLGDLGMLGDRPTHPQLLDWLAAELMDSGWQLKHLHRLILSSRLYHQSSKRRSDLETIDPDNFLLGRMPIRRLESESLRDSLLAISGELNRSMYGDPVPVREDEVGQIVIGKEMLDGERKPVKSEGLGAEAVRRSVYVQVRRSRPLAVLDTFDAPRMTPNCAQRSVSNVAPQPLMMMNSDFVLERAQRLAERVRNDVGSETEKQVQHAWMLVFNGPPTVEEIESAKTYLEQQANTLDDQGDPLSTLCHALISTNRLLYID